VGQQQKQIQLTPPAGTSMMNGPQRELEQHYVVVSNDSPTAETAVADESIVINNEQEEEQVESIQNKRDTDSVNNKQSGNNDNNDKATSMTPLPMGSIFAIVTIFMVEGFVYSFIFPFMGYMILDFGLVKDAKDAGYYAGVLTGAFAIAEFFAGFVYGPLADKVSKKRVILASTLGCGLTVIGFGFCRRYVSALFVRALNGALSGSIVTTRAHITEITDASNQAMAFSLITIGWGLGAIAGPAIGGFLSSPATKYPSVFGHITLFKTFPYLLPCLIAAVVMIIDFVIVLVFMKDVKRAPLSTEVLEEETDIEMNNAVEENAQEEQQQHEEEVGDEIEISVKEPLVSKLGNVVRRELSETVSILWSKEIVTSLALGFFCIMIEIFQDELLPLWSMIERSEGGLSFTTNQIGIVQSIFGGLYLVIPVIYPTLSKWFGHLVCLRVGFIGIVVLVFTPQLALLSSKPWLWTGFVVYSLIRAFTGTLTFTASLILISNSAEEKASGRVQGISNSLGSIARTVAPLVAGPLLASSINLGSKIPAVNVNIPFAFFCVFSVLSFAISFILTKDIENPKAASLQKDKE